MNAIKEKLEKLRIESDSNLSRAEKAEEEVKSLKEQLSKQETTIQNLNNKVSLLSQDLERAEKRAEDSKQKKEAADKHDDIKDALNRKIQMLEKQLDDKERERKDATEK
ncbi:tropomyosin [Globomyces pollinis-pini]|nr:tropomyosin [Globomyces pollinis-pini]